MRYNSIQINEITNDYMLFINRKANRNIKAQR